MMQRVSFWFRYLVVFGGFVVGIQRVLAQDGPKGLLPGNNEKYADKIRNGEVTTDDIPGIILHAVDFFLMIAGGIAVIMIMVGGAQLVLGGLMENKESGKKTLQYAVIGLFVAFLSWFAVDQVQKYLTAKQV